jgi:hypothetical protein
MNGAVNVAYNCPLNAKFSEAADEFARICRAPAANVTNEACSLKIQSQKIIVGSFGGAAAANVAVAASMRFESAMNNLKLKSRRGATSVRAPVIVNQLGPELRQAIADHWSLPSIIDHPCRSSTMANSGWRGCTAHAPLCRLGDGAIGKTGRMAV